MSEKKRYPTKKTENKTSSKNHNPEIWGIVLSALGVILFVCLCAQSAYPLTALVSKALFGLFGIPAFLFPLLLFTLGVRLVAKRNFKQDLPVYIMSFFLIAVISSFFHLFSGATREYSGLFGDGAKFIGGGVIGGLIESALEKLSGDALTFIILLALFIILFVLSTGLSISDLFSKTKKWFISRREQKKTTPAEEPVSASKKNPTARTKTVIDNDKFEFHPEDIKVHTHNQTTIEDISSDTKEDIKTPEKFSPEEIIPADEINEEIKSFVHEKEYFFPSSSQLDYHKDLAGAVSKPEDLRESAKKLIKTLNDFGVEAKVLEVSRGPAITRYELQPSAGVKVSKIVNLADDIALNLAAGGIRIEAPIPGKAAIGIEVPNSSVSAVSLRDVVESPKFTEFKSKTAFAMGKDIAGDVVISDIAKMPHLLIAGATGSGKSVCINSLILGLMFKASPEDVKLLMIDPKVVELKMYEGIPHLLIPVVTDPRKAAGALGWAVREMERRYREFSLCNVRDIQGYNEYALSDGLAKMPAIVIIIDELADLMMVSPHEVEEYIARLTQLARAAGMHLVVATQRPSVDVVTGLIKANIPSRIAFACSSQIDSRTILDMSGAEKLLGRGDMLYLAYGASKPIRIQGTFVSDKEVERVVEFVKNDEPCYDEDVLEQINKADSDAPAEDDPGDNDSLLEDAIEIVVDAGQASVSLIQRRLKVGYARAGRIIDQMEARGVVGPYQGSKPRDVLITRAQFHEMMMNES